jgi:NodT family efflux transporter outer membrane factor (OMF) lipoprotein
LAPPPPPPPDIPSAVQFSTKPPKFVNFLRLHLYLNYELDIWGKYILGVKAARETTKSYLYDVETIQLDIAVEVANNYFSYRKASAEIAILEKLLKIAVEHLSLERDRASAGLTADFETLLANESITRIVIQLATARALQETTKARLATLCAIPQDLFAIEPGTLPPPTTIPRAIHCNLLNQRPDVQRLAHLLEAARLQIGIAKVAFLPDLTINPYVGFEAQKANKLFKWQNRVWSLSGQMLYNLFNGFQSTALLEEARCEYEKVLSQYLERVLFAAQEVEQALALGESSAESYNENRVKLQFIHRRQQLQEQLYQSGITNKPPLLTVTQEVLEQETEVVNAQYNYLSAWTRLVRSIGGGVPSF